MDFSETRKWIEKTMEKRGVDSLDFGGIAVGRDFEGQLTIETGKETFGMDRVPAEIFDKLSAEIKTYRNLDADDPQTERTAAEQAAYDFQ